MAINTHQADHVEYIQDSNNKKHYLNAEYLDGHSYADIKSSVANHYSPTANSDSELTATISGTAGAYAKDKEYTVLTGIKAQRDAKGHVTGLTYTAQKIKDTNTTYTFNGAVSTIKDSNLTASRALISDNNGKIAISDVTSAELSYLDGVTSSIQTQLNAKLDKTTYEWNKEFAAGSNGAVSLGRYNIYDSQLTFDITSTTNQSLSGKLVIATQNGTIHQAKVFGDASGALVSKLIIYQSAISNSRSWVEVFCNFNGWSKNKVHIYAVALNSATVQKQMTSVTISNGVPAAANVTSGDTKWTGTIVNDFSHSHGISIAASSGTNQLNLAHGTKYALTAGGQSFVFTTPSDNNTHNSHAIISGTKSDGSTQIKGSASSDDITLGDSGVTAGAYGDTADQTPGYNATFKVPSISVNAKGIVTAVGEHTVTIPDNSNLVPYTGASKDVNLGNHSLSISDKTDTRGTMIKVSGKGVSEDDVWTTIEPDHISMASPGIAYADLLSSRLTISDGAYSGTVTEKGFEAGLRVNDNYSSSKYGYDGITRDGKKLSLPEKEGTIALTSDLSTLLDKGTSSTVVNQVVYNPVEMKKALKVPSIRGENSANNNMSGAPLYSLGGTMATENGQATGSSSLALAGYTGATGNPYNTTLTQTASGVFRIAPGGNLADTLVWSQGWKIQGSKILTESSISTQQWKLTSTSGTVTTVNICTK